MNWKTYKNELLVALSLLVLVLALSYKVAKVSQNEGTASTMGTSLYELEKIIALKKVWGNKKISKKVDKLKTLVPASKVQWQKKSKKLTAVFSSLDERELNKVVSTLLNLAVVIQKIELKRTETSYNLEFTCKW